MFPFPNKAAACHALVPLLWIAVTFGAYLGAQRLYREHRRWWTAPLLVTWLLCGLLLLASRTPIATRQNSRAEWRWIVVRSVVAWITERSSRARVRSPRRKPSMRVQSPTYPLGAYWS